MKPVAALLGRQQAKEIFHTPVSRKLVLQNLPNVESAFHEYIPAGPNYRDTF